MSGLKVRATTLDDCLGYNQCVDVVAREKIYLLRVVAPPLSASETYIKSMLERKLPHYVAVDGNKVVGWCDVNPLAREEVQHRGSLGIGILPEYRSKGLGTKLIKETLIHAKNTSLKKIELSVYTDNQVAIGLYKKFGFEAEGLIKRFRCLDGKFDDVVVMGLLL